jgi:hypothetical protein
MNAALSSVRVAVSVPIVAMANSLREAERLGISVSDLIRRIIDEYREQKEREAGAARSLSLAD